jgi:hypothetical protein
MAQQIDSVPTAVADSAVAKTDRCKYLPCPQPGAKERDVQLDARDNLAVVRGDVRFKQRGRVVVWLLNDNPFRFRTRFPVVQKGVALAEPNLSTITGGIPSPTSTPSPVPATTASTTAPSNVPVAKPRPFNPETNQPKGKPPKAPCTAVGDWNDQLAALHDRASSVTAAPRTAHLQYTSYQKSAVDFQNYLLDAARTGSQLFFGARHYLALVTKTDSGLRTVNRDTAELAKLRDSIAKLSDAPPDDGCQPATPRTTVSADSAAIDSAFLFLRTVPLAIANGDSVVQILAGAVLSNDVFIHRRGIEGLDDSASVATVYELRADRYPKDTATKLDTAGTIVLHFGTTRAFALAAGIGIARFPKTEYGRVQTVQNDTAATVIGVTSDQKAAVPVLAAAHLRIYRFGQSDFTLHLTVAADIGQDLTSSQRDWLPGVSLGFVNERAFVTLGPLVGTVQALPSDLKVGQSVPQSVATLPLITRTQVGVGLAVTYRVY